MLFTKILIKDSIFNDFRVEIVTNEIGKVYPMFDDCFYVFPASAAEYMAYRRQIQDEIRRGPIRETQDFYDVAPGVTIPNGYTLKPNRRQRRELYENRAFTSLFYSLLEECEGE